MVIESDVPRADDSEVALERRCSRVATHDAARRWPTGVEAFLAHRLGAHLAERGEVGQRLLQPAFHARSRLEVVIGDQRPEVVSGERDQDGVHELARSAGVVEGLAGVSR
jgi:hypothetical protein